MKKLLLALFLAMPVGISGCIQVPTAAVAPKTINEALVAAYVSVSGVQNLAADLYVRGRIDRNTARQVLEQTVAIRAALDLAATTKDEKTVQAATDALIMLEQQLKARQ